MNETTLSSIEAQKKVLFEQQQSIAAQLANLQRQERELEKESRLDALKTIENLIVQYNIPRGEITEIYQKSDINIRKTYTKRVKDNSDKNPTLNAAEDSANREIADQLNKLYMADHEVFKHKVIALGDKIEAVIGFVDEKTEISIIEVLA